jgi:hypothetical protein
MLRAHDSIGFSLLVAAAFATVPSLWKRLGFYDEGLLLANAQMMLNGAVPYRDFYTNYPPGMFLIIGAIWKVLGTHVVLIRILGLFFHLMIAGLVGRLAGRISGRSFVPFAAGVALAFMIALGAVPYAYLGAVALALLFVELLTSAVTGSAQPARLVAAGLALGAVAAFRHDVFVLLCCGYGLLALGMAMGRKVAFDAGVFKGSAWFGLGVLVPLALVWIPTLARAGFRQVVADLFLDQVRFMLPARVLPFPKLIPDSAVEATAGAVVLLFLGPALTLVAWLTTREPARRLCVLLVGIVALSVLPQSCGRSDHIHVVYGISPGIILLGALIDRRLRARSLRWAWVSWVPTLWLLLLVAPSLKAIARLPDAKRARAIWPAVPIGHYDARRSVLDFVAGHTSPGDPIFVGARDHRRVLWNEMALYFLANRPGAVRRMQFDPNMVTRAEFQAEMIADLEAERPKVVVLSSRALYCDEPNRSREWGASLLDEYLATHYTVAKEVEAYRLLVPRSGQAAHSN